MTSIVETAHQLLALSVQPGGVLLVHTGYRAIRPIEGGIAGLIAALWLALGSDGTLVMPSMSWEDDDVFDPAATPCPEMGAVADYFWRMPGVQRSNSPHAFAAHGPHAAAITAPHPYDVPHGPNSPIGRVHALDGQVLMLGIDHSADTTLHLAEHLAGVPYAVEKYITIMEQGEVKRLYYHETDHCGQRLALAGGWLDARGLQRTGLVGAGTAMLAHSRDIVAVALEHLRADPLVFLHPPGTDEECDAAHLSIRQRGGQTPAVF